MKATVTILSLLVTHALGVPAAALQARQDANPTFGDVSGGNSINRSPIKGEDAGPGPRLGPAEAIQAVRGPNNPKPKPIRGDEAGPGPAQEAQAQEQVKKNLINNGMSEEDAKKRVEELKAQGFFEVNKLPATAVRGPDNPKPKPIRGDEAGPGPAQEAQAQEQVKKNLINNGMSEEDAKKRVEELKAQGFFEVNKLPATAVKGPDNPKPKPIRGDEAGPGPA